MNWFQRHRPTTPNTKQLETIDIDFMRQLPRELHATILQEQLGPPPYTTDADTSEASDAARFIMSLTDDSLRDEILLSSPPEVILTLPPELVERAKSLRQRFSFLRHRGEYENLPPSRSKGAVAADSLEDVLLIPSCNEGSESEIILAVRKQVQHLPEYVLEGLIKVLYLNTSTKMPLNALFLHLCRTPRILNKVLTTLLYILKNHESYESYIRSQLVSKSVAAGVSDTEVAVLDFPPLYLYRGLQNKHLTYSVVSLRIVSLLKTLLAFPTVTDYFFRPVVGGIGPAGGLRALANWRRSGSWERLRIRSERLLWQSCCGCLESR